MTGWGKDAAKDVLQKIAEGIDPATLTPRIWKAARSQAVAH
jgi:hypothetical protein